MSPGSGKAAAIAPLTPAPAGKYYWKSQPAGDSAELVTLFCNLCGNSPGRSAEEVPLVAVLRDTLGDDDSGNDQLTYVWLLSSTHQTIGKRLLAAVPFFYWRVGDGSTRIDEDRPVKPLMDLTRPEQPMSVQAMRNILQWTVLDPLSMPVRATSRAYTANQTARERSHLEEAISYLRLAPHSESGPGLTQAEIDIVSARLALRKTLLGGLVRQHRAQRVGELENADHEAVRSRNWDLLRGFAERTGLYFEPLAVAGASGDYALLWFPAESGAAEPVGSSHSAVWNALNLRNPWTDPRLKSWEGPLFTRQLDSDGSLLPPGVAGSSEVDLIPLGAYSLTYPKFPLLMIDFRDKLHVRRDEMTQRAINEVTSGLIGISHFANWYYYAGAAAYDFVASRHGRGMDAASRQDSYSQFRSALALDGGMDPTLRALLQRRIDSVSLNPLEGSPGHQVLIAETQYNALLKSIASGELEKRLDKTREAELRDFGKTPSARAGQALLRAGSFNLVAPRYRRTEDLSAELDTARRVQRTLNFLHGAANSGPNPEIAYSVARLRGSVQELSRLLPAVRSKNVRTDAADTLKRLHEMTRDPQLQADCSFGLAALRKPGESMVPGVQAAPRVVVNSLRKPDLRK